MLNPTHHSQALDEEDAALQAALAASLADAPQPPAAAIEPGGSSPRSPASHANVAPAAAAAAAGANEPLSGMKRSPAEAGLAEGGRATDGGVRAAEAPDTVQQQECWEIVEDPGPARPTAARPLVRD